MLRNARKVSGNENGFAMILSILIMVLLTALGTFATRFASTEILISRNESIAGAQFYASDGATRLGFDRLDNMIVAPSTSISQDGNLGSVTYNYSIVYSTDAPCTGCSSEFRNFFFLIDGKSPSTAAGGVSTVASKILRIGY